MLTNGDDHFYLSRLIPRAADTITAADLLLAFSIYVCRFLAGNGMIGNRETKRKHFLLKLNSRKPDRNIFLFVILLPTFQL